MAGAGESGNDARGVVPEGLDEVAVGLAGERPAVHEHQRGSATEASVGDAYGWQVDELEGRGAKGLERGGHAIKVCPYPTGHHYLSGR